MALEQERQPRPLKLEEVSPSTLTDFLKANGSGFKLLPSTTEKDYGEVFTSLRALPVTRQEELLVTFFMQGVENFPNGEKLGQFLAKINNIAWFLPIEEPNPETLKQLSDEFYNRLNIPSPPLRIIKGEWDWRLYDEAGISQRKRKLVGIWGAATWDITEWTTRLHAVDDTAWNMAQSAIPRSRKDIKWDAAMSATWMALENLIPMTTFRKGNPYELLFNGIYDKGYWFVGPMDDESVIFVPKIQTEISKRLKLECFSGGGYQGSEEELQRFLSRIPIKDPVRFYISRDVQVDPNTDYYTDSGSVTIHSIDELGIVREKLIGAEENYHVSVQLIGENGKPLVVEVSPHIWSSPSWGFYLKPKIESIETLVRLVLGEESS